MLLLSLAWVATVRPEILVPVSESVHVRSYVLAGGEDIPYKYAVAAVSFLCEKYPIIAYLHLYLSGLKKKSLLWKNVIWWYIPKLSHLRKYKCSGIYKFTVIKKNLWFHFYFWEMVLNVC